VRANATWTFRNADRQLRMSANSGLLHIDAASAASFAKLPHSAQALFALRPQPESNADGFGTQRVVDNNQKQVRKIPPPNCAYLFFSAVRRRCPNLIQPAVKNPRIL
jgi:hypothetical protein